MEVVTCCLARSLKAEFLICAQCWTHWKIRGKTNAKGTVLVASTWSVDASTSSMLPHRVFVANQRLLLAGCESSAGSCGLGVCSERPQALPGVPGRLPDVERTSKAEKACSSPLLSGRTEQQGVGRFHACGHQKCCRHRTCTVYIHSWGSRAIGTSITRGLRVYN